METEIASTIIQKGELEGKGIRRISRHVQFTLCGSCFWCASYLDGRYSKQCPSCSSNLVESLPVAGNEMYTFSYDIQRGVTIQFVPQTFVA
jgi:hypothetical protein